LEWELHTAWAATWPSQPRHSYRLDRFACPQSRRVVDQWRTEHLLAYFGATPLDQITISDVDAFRLSKVHEGVLSATSINKMITTLAAILETAVEYELIARNPAKGRKRRLPVVTPRRSWLDRAEHITALLDGAEEVDQEGRALVGLRRPALATLAFAGLRLGELQAVRWRDVDLDRGTITVRAAKTDAGVGIVDMLPILCRELSVYRDRLNPDPERPVFATARGNGLGSSNIRLRLLARTVARANVNLEAIGQQPLPAGLTPHSLRRTLQPYRSYARPRGSTRCISRVSASRS
jgi:integrase